LGWTLCWKAQVKKGLPATMVEIRIRDIVLNIVPQAIVVSRLADDT